MNPFATNSITTNPGCNLIGRQEDIENLKSNIKTGTNTVLLGPEGIGKTALLNSLTDIDFRKEMATPENKILISPLIEFDGMITAEEMFHKLYFATCDSLLVLSEVCQDVHKRIKQLEKESSANAVTSKEKFIVLVGAIRIVDYRIVYLIDNFEYFTCSPKITIEQHETLRSQLGASQYIMATNVDLNQDSLPRGVKGSYLLMNFASGELSIKGWSLENCYQYITSALKGNSIRFSDNLIDRIFKSSGGIPFLVTMISHDVYKFIQDNGSEDGLTRISSLMENNELLQILFAHWSKMLTAQQYDTLAALASINNTTGQVDSTYSAAAKTLLNRGLIRNPSEQDKYGHTIQYDNQYVFCTPLYRIFCQNQTAMKEAMAQNPLNDETDDNERDQRTEPGNTDGESEYKNMINDLEGLDPVTDRNRIFDSINSFLSSIGGINHVVDINAELTPEQLRQYNIGESDYMNMKDDEKAFICEGIHIKESFSDMIMADYGPICLSFCKALETHLYHTLIQVMLNILGEERIEYYNKDVVFKQINHSLMTLGNIHHVLTQPNRTFHTAFYQQLCREIQFIHIPPKERIDFWKTYIKDLGECTEIRNKCPHKNMLTQDDFDKFLRLVFQGRDSFWKKTDLIYNTFKASSTL